MKYLMLKTYARRQAGEEYKLPLKIGRAYVKAGIAREVAETPAPTAQPSYMTRHLVAAPPVAPTVAAPTNVDSLDEMDVEELRAVAESRGVKFHHRAGAEKLREALREAEG
jgi:hypothetical protein